MMSNYYLIKGTHEKICPHCGSTTKELVKLHIGKSTVGWCFSLHVIPEDGINSLDDWIQLFEHFKIIDEENNEVHPSDMIRKITNRRGISYNDEYIKTHGAIRGPDNLLRSKIDGFCIGHGEGTFDYFIGDFS
jgi:hypothetical protein